MLYKIVKYAGGTEYDFSDWVKRIDKVPFFTKNVNRTLMAEGYSFEFSSESSITLAKGDKILFYRDTTLVHIGIIDKMDLNEDTLLYNVDVNHLLNNLNYRNTGVTYQVDGESNPLDLVDVLLAASTETEVNGITFDLINYKTLIEKIVNEAEAAGVTLDWSGYYADTNFVWKCYQAGDADLTLIDSPSVDENSLYFLAQQINCSGIGGIYAPEEFDNERDTDRPSLFELLSLLICMRSLSFIPKDASSFYVVSRKSDPSGSYFADDEMFEIISEEEIVESMGIEATYATLDYHQWFGGYLDIPTFVYGSTYFEGDYVLYESNYWRAIKDTPEGYPGDNGSGGSDWYQITVDIEMDAYLQPNFDQDLFVQYKHNLGVKPSNINWMDNFNPIIIDSGEAYFCLPYPDVTGYVGSYVFDGKSCAHYLFLAELNSYTKITREVPATKVFGATLYEYESVYISDINNDTIEVEVIE